MATYYVDTAADPGGDGTTQATTGAHCAWDTVADVNAASFSGDDFCLFKRGCHWHEKLTPPSAGTAGHLVTFGAYGTGADPIIWGADPYSSWTQYSSGTGDQAGNLIDDNFDDGDLAGWSLTGTPTADTTYAHSGTYSALFNAQECMYQDVAGSSEIWVQLEFYAAALPAADRNFMYVMKNDGTNFGNLFIKSDGSIQWWNAIGSSLQDTGYDYVAGNWMNVELRWRKSATVGQTQCWIDGTSKFNLSSQNNGATDCSRVQVGPGNAAATMYLDDVKVDNVGYIGIATPTNYWYKTCDNTAGVVFEDNAPMSFCEWDTDPSTSFSGASAPAFTIDTATPRAYIWCTANADPSTKTIEISKRDYCINGNGVDYLGFENLVCAGSYRHGFVGAGADGYSLTDVEVKWCGGTKEGADYLGDGVVITPPATGWTLTRVTSHDNFDVGITIENDGIASDISTITFDTCECYRNRAAGFEILEGSGSGDISDITLQDCIGRNQDGLGWSGTHVNGSGIYIDNYGTGTFSGIEINDSEFHDNQRGTYILTATGTVTLNRIDVYDNTIEGILVSDQGTTSGNLLTDNFDDNDISDWSLTGTPAASGGVVNFNAAEYMEKTITASDEIWIQVQFYAAGLPAANRNLFMLEHGATNLGNIFLESDGDLKWWNNAGSSVVDTTYDYVAGTTVIIELHWKLGAGTGILEVWADGGAAKYSNSAQQNGTTHCDTIRLGPNDGAYTFTFDNVKVDNTGYIGTAGGTDTSLDAYYCNIWGNTEDGLEFNVPHGTALILYDNAFFDNGDDTGSTRNCRLVAFEPTADHKIKNNIFFGTDSMAFYDTQGLDEGADVDYNCYYRGSGNLMYRDGTTYTTAQFGTYQTDSSQDSHGFYDDPEFVSTGTPNFHIKSTSPCLGAGTGVGLANDHAGNPVPATPDIGSYQYDNELFKYWDGDSWERGRVMVYTSGSWQEKIAKRWAGHEWIDVDGLGG